MNKNDVNALKVAFTERDRLLFSSLPSSVELNNISFSPRLEKRIQTLLRRQQTAQTVAVGWRTKRKALLVAAILLLLGALSVITVTGGNIKFRPYDAYIEDEVQQKKLHITSLGEKISLNYLESEGEGTGKREKYVDVYGDQYWFDYKGLLISWQRVEEDRAKFFYPKPEKMTKKVSETPITEAQSVALAEQYGRAFCGAEYDKFEINYIDNGDPQYGYTLQYFSYLHGKDYVGEIMSIDLDKYGNLEAIIRHKQSLLQELDLALLDTFKKSDVIKAAKAQIYAQQDVYNAKIINIIISDRIFICDNDPNGNIGYALTGEGCLGFGVPLTVCLAPTSPYHSNETSTTVFVPLSDLIQ